MVKRKDYDAVVTFIAHHNSEGGAIYGPFKTADEAAKFIGTSAGWVIKPVLHPKRGQ